MRLRAVPTNVLRVRGVIVGLARPMSAPGYGGRPAARQAAVKASARAGTIPTAAQYPRELKDGGNASTCAAAALASSVRPSLASAAASRLWDTLKLGFDRTARFAAF